VDGGIAVLFGVVLIVSVYRRRHSACRYAERPNAR
jgi:hypothetical protein